MKRLWLTPFLIILYSAFSHAQSTEIKYYNNESLTKEVTKEKAKFSRSIIQNADGSVTTKVENMGKGTVIQSKTWKGNEPFGIWKIQTGKGMEDLDYDFPLIYTDQLCRDSTMKDGSVQTPKLLSGDSTIINFLVKNVRYPPFARENNIQGRVVVQFTISETGSVQDAVVVQGVQTTLDKEAVRVVRKMKFYPPVANGQPHKICMKLPVTFRLA